VSLVAPDSPKPPTFDAIETILGRLNTYSSSGRPEAGWFSSHALMPFPWEDLVDERIEPWWISLYFGYLAFGVRDVGGQRLVDRFEAKHAHALPADEATALRALLQSRAVLHEVISDSRATARLRDLLTGEELVVLKRNGNREPVGRIGFGWVFPLGGDVARASRGVGIPDACLARVRERAEAELRSAGARWPRLSDGDLLGTCVPAVASEIFDHLRERERSQAEASERMFCKATYAVRDEGAVADQLRRLEWLRPWEDEFVWMPPPDDPDFRGEEFGEQLGEVGVRDGELAIHADSSALLARARELIEAALGELVEHRRDLIQTPSEWSREVDRRLAQDRRARSDRPAADAADSLVRSMAVAAAKHCEAWLDEPHPALDRRTPRAVATTAEGRAAVEPLWHAEQLDVLRSTFGLRIDFTPIQDAIGLPSEPPEIQYDPAVDMDPRWWLLYQPLCLLAVYRYHGALERQDDLSAAELHHVSMHHFVEAALAHADRDAVAAFERLRAAGVPRHDAIHAVGSVLLPSGDQPLAPYDPAAKRAALDAIDPEAWLPR
jgi:uncharacterized protein (DUF2384 family)